MYLVFTFIDIAKAGETVIDVNLSREGDSYFMDHKIDGRNLFPVAGYILLAWRTFSKSSNTTYDKTPVILENLVFHRPTLIPKEGSVKIGINFFKGTGLFEISEYGALTVSGKISIPEDVSESELSLPDLSEDAFSITLNSTEIYKELRLRGYEYSGVFCGIISSDSQSITGRLRWQHNWISFIDTMLQFTILGREQRDLYLPLNIDRVVINPLAHYECIEKTQEIPVYMYHDVNVIKSGGIQISGLNVELFPRRLVSHTAPVLEDYKFVPLHNNLLDRFTAITVLVQLAMENSLTALKIKVADVVAERHPDDCMFMDIYKVIENEPRLTSDVSIYTTKSTQPYIKAIGDSVLRVGNKDVRQGAIESGCHLVTGYDLTNDPDANAILQNMFSSILDTGFILLEENQYREESADRLFVANNLICISAQHICGRAYLLLRRKLDISLRKNKIIFCTEKSFAWVTELKDALATIEQEPCHVYLVCQGEALFGAGGLYNCIRLEAAGKFVRVVHVYDQGAEQFSLTGSMYKDLLSADLAYQAYRNGEWGSLRHLKLECHPNDPSLATEHAYINTLVKGDFSTLQWIEGPLSKQPHNIDDENFELCSVYYAPVTHRDIMFANGLNSTEKSVTNDWILGQEFSGRDSTGKRVMGLVEARALATKCVANKTLLWDIPDNWTMEQASTVPLAYAIAYYSLMMRGNIRMGESVLIHAGCDAIGQAAIHLALAHGLTVFTTIESDEMRELIKNTFPQLQNHHIGNSQKTSFEQLVLRQTHGRGVDIVFCSLSAATIVEASLRCLATNGRFLQLGKLDMNYAVGMSVLLKNASLQGIVLENVFRPGSQTLNEVVKLISVGIRAGVVQPLSRRVFKESEVEQAFRLVASKRQIGKVVIEIRKEDDGNLANVVKIVNAIPRTYMVPSKTYVIVGGLGDLGLEVAHWFVSRGANKLVLTSRLGVRNGLQAMMISRWERMGVTVRIDTNDVTTTKGVEALLRAAANLGPVGGIFNLAAVLIDGLIENQTESNFEEACKPKVDGTKCLDLVSRRLCSQLDYFVCFSSIMSGRGNIGQANYGLANSAMDRICEARSACNLPGTAMQWGAIDDTRMITQNIGVKKSIINGALSQKIPSFLQTMDLFLTQKQAVLSSLVLDDKRKAHASREAGLVSFLASSLGIKDLKNVSEQASLADMGMDSLMATETKQMLERTYNVALSLGEIRKLNFKKLRKIEKVEQLK